MLSSVFGQQLFEVLLECLLQIDDSNVKLYDKFCDRLEKEMFPSVVSNQHDNLFGESSNTEQALPFLQAAFIELKIPYMAIIEQKIEQEEKE